MGERITREDIENKIRDIQGGLEGEMQEARALVPPIIVALVLILIGLAYALGRRGGRKRAMILEIKSE